jgi:hypothetical protein
MIAKHEQVLRASMQLVPIANGLLKQEIGEPLHKVLRASLTLGQSTASLTARAWRRPSLSRLSGCTSRMTRCRRRILLRLASTFAGDYQRGAGHPATCR